MNMDRHKYRAWFNFADDGWKMVDLQGFYLKHSKTGPITIVLIDTEDGVYEGILGKDCTLMQCTGLKDSEGNLVYEGDVVEFLGGARGVIVWGEDDCVACFTVEYEEGGEKFRDYDYLEDKGLKVLGNIYEGDTKNAKRD